MNFPIRQGIEVIPADEPRVKYAHDRLVIGSNGKLRKQSNAIGWTVHEVIGMAIINPGCLTKLTKDTK